MIVAADEANGIGLDNRLLCHLPGDLKYFRQMTSGHCIVMGRKTFESIGRPLPNRTNIVVTRSVGLSIQGCVVVNNLNDAIAYAREHGETELMITGGGTIYQEALSVTDRIYLTRIHHQFQADAYFPDVAKSGFRLVQSTPQPADEKNAYAHTFEVWER